MRVQLREHGLALEREHPLRQRTGPRRGGTARAHVTAGQDLPHSGRVYRVVGQQQEPFDHIS